MGLMGKRKQIKIDNNIDDKKKLSNRGASGRKVVSYGKDPVFVRFYRLSKILYIIFLQNTYEKISKRG